MLKPAFITLATLSLTQSNSSHRSHWPCNILLLVALIAMDHSGRMFYKCSNDDKCRSFYWEDSMGKAGGPAAGAGASSTASQINARSASVFNGGGGNVLGSSPAAGRTFTASSQMKAAPPASGASTSATEYTQSPVSPSKRPRVEVIEDEEEDDDNESTMESERSGPTGWGGFRSRRPPPQSSPKSASKALKTSQTVEEAIEEDWDDEIDDFEEFEAGQGSPSPNKGKFTSFAGPSTPKTPPRKLAPGLPVTPSSMNAEAGPSGTTDNKWNQILSDPSSPFHARAAALMNSGGGGGQTSPASGSTASLLPSSSTESAGEAAGGVPRTPSNNALGAGAAPQTPSEHLGSLSALAQQFSTSLQTELESASKAVKKSENLMRAAQKKAEYHLKRETALKEEMERLKEKIRLLEAENSQLKALGGA